MINIQVFSSSPLDRSLFQKKKWLVIEILKYPTVVRNFQCGEWKKGWKFSQMYAKKRKKEKERKKWTVRNIKCKKRKKFLNENVFWRRNWRVAREPISFALHNWQQGELSQSRDGNYPDTRQNATWRFGAKLTPLGRLTN